MQKLEAASGYNFSEMYSHKIPISIIVGCDTVFELSFQMFIIFDDDQSFDDYQFPSFHR
jgi:hypothetical protein